MPDKTQDKVITQGHIRQFTQRGGPRPNNPVRYAGQDEQFLAVMGVSNPVSGSIKPVRVPDPNRPKRYINIGRSIDPADFAKAALHMRSMHGRLPLAMGDLSCPFNIYTPVGSCKDLSDFSGGWGDFVGILSDCEAVNRDFGDLSPWENDNALETKVDLTVGDYYGIGSLGFGDNATSTINREVVDAVYGTSAQCGDCGPANDGTQLIYALTKSSGSGSPGLPAQVVYSTDGGATWNSLTINGIGASEDPIGIYIAGTYLIVLSRTAGSATSGGYYYATIDSNTGIPGAFTKVTNGFVANKQPNDAFVMSTREVFIAADGGYIYKVQDVAAGAAVNNAGSATTSNLLRIHGDQKTGTLVATGQNSAAVVSTNRGATWSATQASPSAIATDLTAVAVLDNNRYWIGTGVTGRLVYTLNGGISWTEQAFDSSGQGTIRDIVFATQEAGYFSHDTPTPTARIFSTWNGGANWTRQAPRIRNFPVFNRATRLAAPTAGVAQTNANNLAVAGLAGDGTDGILLLGVVPTL